MVEAMTPVETRRLGRSNLSVTCLGLGGAPLGNLFDPVAEEDARRTVAAAWDAGVRYFDTAPLYGHGLSERRLGEALRAHPRPSFVLSTKVGRVLEPRDPSAMERGAYVEVPPLQPVFDYTADGVRRSVEASLERLGLPRVDILLIHDVGPYTHGAEGGERTYREAMAGAYPALDRLRREGAVRAIGLGVNEWRIAQRCVEGADLDCVLLAGRYTLLEQEPLDTFLPLCERRGVGVVIGGPFNSGILAAGDVPGATYDYAPAPEAVRARTRRLDAVCRRHGVPLGAAALQFPLGHPAVATVIPGARSAGEVRRNVELLGWPIPAALWDDLRHEGLLRPDAPAPGGSPGAS